MKTATPKRISPAITAICKEVSPELPVFLPVKPIAGEPFNECVNVVERKVDREGGSIQLGWLIWEFAFTWIDLEFHAVWRSPAGDLVDISPKPDGEQIILFLIDNSLHFDGQRIDNITKPLRKHELIDEALRLVSARRQYMPAPGKQISLSPNHPVVGIEWRLAAIIPQLVRKSDVRRRSRKG